MGFDSNPRSFIVKLLSTGRVVKRNNKFLNKIPKNLKWQNYYENDSIIKLDEEILNNKTDNKSQTVEESKTIIHEAGNQTRSGRQNRLPIRLNDYILNQ